MMKEQLLEIFVKFCLPRTQRKSRDSGKNRMAYQHENVSYKDENNSNSVYKCDTINGSNEDNAMMECDKFPPAKQKFISIDSVPTENCSQDNLFSLKRKIPRDVSHILWIYVIFLCSLINIFIIFQVNKFIFDSPVKRQRTHTG